MERESLSKKLDQETIEWRHTMMKAIAECNETALLLMLAKDTTTLGFKVAGTTPLHLAAENGNSNIMRMLISHGADFRIKNSEGKTPMEILMTKKQSANPDLPKNVNQQLRATLGELEISRTDADLWQEQHKAS